MKKPYLSIVIPAHNEERRLPKTFNSIDKFLKKQKYSAEVIVVENGSSDNTSEIIRQYAKKHKYIKLLEVETRGKGLAVKQGMLASKGEYRFICDADLSMPIEEVSKFLPPNTDGFDVMIGVREGKGAKRIGEPFKRHFMGRAFNLIIKLTILPGFEDTQCGFKMFSVKSAQDLFGIQKLNGIGFDIELIYLARKKGYRIKEIPITWYYDADSRMRLVQDSLKALLEIWEIRKTWWSGGYNRE
jgi:glycosyltransferase involved in cell wall biosynthesis